MLEDWGVWSDGPQAIVELQLPPGGSGAPVELTGRVFLAEARHPEVTLTLEANGTVVAAQYVVASDPRATLTVPGWCADTRGTLRLRLRINHPRSPRDAGLSDDRRSLGFGLETIRMLHG